MFLMAIIPLISMLRFVNSNYKGSDHNSISSSDRDSENCKAEHERISCFCYNEPENDFEYQICPNKHNPGKYLI